MANDFAEHGRWAPRRSTISSREDRSTAQINNWSNVFSISRLNLHTGQFHMSGISPAVMRTAAVQSKLPDLEHAAANAERPTNHQTPETCHNQRCRLCGGAPRRCALWKARTPPSPPERLRRNAFPTANSWPPRSLKSPRKGHDSDVTATTTMNRAIGAPRSGQSRSAALHGHAMHGGLQLEANRSAVRMYPMEIELTPAFQFVMSPVVRLISRSWDPRTRKPTPDQGQEAPLPHRRPGGGAFRQFRKHPAGSHALFFLSQGGCRVATARFFRRNGKAEVLCVAEARRRCHLGRRVWKGAACSLAT